MLILNWRDTSGETGYRVERSTNGTSFTTVATLGSNISSWTDGNVTAGTTYYYRLIPLSSYGDTLVATASRTAGSSSSGSAIAGASGAAKAAPSGLASSPQRGISAVEAAANAAICTVKVRVKDADFDLILSRMEHPLGIGQIWNDENLLRASRTIDPRLAAVRGAGQREVRHVHRWTCGWKTSF